MNIYIASSLIAFLSGTSVAGYVYIKNNKHPLNRIFALEVFLMSTWCLYPTAVGLYKPFALIGVKLVYIAAIFNTPIFTQFCFTLLEIHDHARERRIVFLLYCLSILLITLLPSSLFIKDIVRLQSHYSIEAGELFSFFSVSFISVCLYNFYRLLKTYRKANKTQQNQFKYFIIAFIIAFLGGILHFFSIYSRKSEYFPHDFLIIAFVFICAYAILRYHLLDINIVIKHTLVYSALITLITIIFILAILITEMIFRGIFGYATLPMNILAATIIALIFIPLKNQIQYVLDKLFFKGTIDTLAKEKAIIYKELMRSERLKAVATLSAGMAHEIKNPLTAIKTFTEHLKDHKDDPEFVDKFQRIVGAEVEKINDLVRQLLDFSRPKPLSLKQTNIHDLLDDILALLNSDMIKQKISLYKKYGYIPALMVDPDQLKQAFLNIILNAIEAMPSGGELKVATYWINGKDSIEIMIQDEGKGMSIEELSHIFDPFHSTKEAGTGLGLSITHEIIKKHNGTITVDSLVGFGTTVKIRFMGVLP